MKVSVVIPVYNAATTLTRCLASLSAQTLRDFEVVCVDDGSSDGSLELLRDHATWHGEQSGVRLVILSQENRGTYLARKRGVEVAQGEYVCFVDPDDQVKPRFLEKMVKAAERGDWDVVQCGVELEETRERTAKQRAVSERYFNPDAPTIKDGGLLTRAYIHKRIGWNLIFRLFRASIVKEAFAELPDVNMINETDAAAFFPIARRARSFRRIRDRLYVYRYGDGISTRTDYSLDDYCRTLGKFDFVRCFAPRIRTKEEEAAFVIMAARMAENSRKSAFARIVNPATREKALALLAESFRPKPRKVTHVGIHYFNLKFGGVQRVVLQNVELLRSIGLRVTLFLEELPNDECFSVPGGVEIRILPRSLGNMLPDEKRIPQIAEAMRASGIDCWYDHAVFAPGFVSNVVTAKWLLGLSVVAHYHTVFMAPLHFKIHSEYFELQAHWLRLADVVLTLGQVDAAYFRSQAVNAVVMPNALPDICREVLCGPIPTPVGRKILWCGRESWEKHPEDAEKITALVKQKMPDVELVMLSGVKDPYPYFAEASVFLSTSEMEGFSMASAEALAYGLPVVAYRLGNLDLYRDNPAVFQITQGDVKGAAEKIVEIVSRADYCNLRQSARRFLRPFVEFDHSEFWRSFRAGTCPVQSGGNDEVVHSEMQSLLAEGLVWRAAHPKPKGCDPVTFRRIKRYICDNGFWYTVQKAFKRIVLGGRC